MAQLPYTKKAFIERVEKHLNDDFPGEDFKITSNEILLYIDSFIPGVMKGNIFENAKVTGFLDVPEGYLATYSFTISNRNSSTKEWYVTLPQTPLALPTGYDITNVYVADPVNGRSKNAFPVKVKREAIRSYLPKPSGFAYRLDGDMMYLSANDGGSLLNYELQVQMPISRTEDIDAVMTLPDDAIEIIFQKTIATILQRYQIPQDVVKDNLPAGNKTS